MLFDDKKILITGGTGTVGQELTRILLSDYSPSEIIIFSRSEVAQVQMKTRFLDKPIRFIIGDVRDYTAVRDAFAGVDYVFHLAALKHVGICEQNPQEAIKTNVTGATNVIRSAIYNKVPVVVNMSTDKAVNPAGTYGHTKALAEKLFCNAPARMATQFKNVRSGNIFGSSGSVVPILIKQVQATNTVKITFDDMTRFFLSKKEIAEYLIWVALQGDIGKVYITDNAESFRLRDLAEVICEVYGNGETQIQSSGNIGPSEKVHEEMFSKFEDVYILLQNGVTDKATDNRVSSDCVVDKSYLKTWINGNFGY